MIIPVKGAVKFPITLDPSVWIFDDRRVDLKTYFQEEQVEVDEDLEYTKATSKHWSREIMEGAVVPPTLKTEKKFEKTKVLTGTFGIQLHYFIKNAEPLKEATQFVFETSTGDEYSFPLEDAKNVLLKYSDEGKPLKEDGPVHVLLTDGSNVNDPIKHVQAIRVE